MIWWNPGFGSAFSELGIRYASTVRATEGSIRERQMEREWEREKGEGDRGGYRDLVEPRVRQRLQRHHPCLRV